MAEMLTQVSTLFDNIFEVVVHVWWKAPDILQLVTQSSAQSYHLLDR